MYFDKDALLQQFWYDPSHPLLFNNGFFIYFFTAFVLLYYTFRNHVRIRSYIFIIFSLYFFYKASGLFVGMVVLSALVVFALTNLMHRISGTMLRKSLLVIGIFLNLGVLFYFKYTGFAVELSNEWLHTSFHPLNILLPVGISFYTFENLSYLIDVYRREIKPAKRFSDYLLFLSFFPKLVMGPIVRAADFIPQIRQKYVITEQQFNKGFLLIVSGLIKKLFISDYLTANFTDYVFADPGLHTGLECLMAVYAYAMVIYCDFSGYSDMAIGIAQWLGFTIPENFRSPYQSSNITEFWRRWHISLSSWLRDYLYIPLGGNLKATVGTFLICTLFFLLACWAGIHIYQDHGDLAPLLVVSVGGIVLISTLVIQRKHHGYNAGLNQFSTMLLGGLWHGASLNFVIWGAWHGLGLAVHKAWLGVTRGKSTRRSRPITSALAIFLTFHFVCIGWVFFRALTVHDALTLFKQIIFDLDLRTAMPFFLHYRVAIALMATGYLSHAVPDYYLENLYMKANRVPVIVYLMVLLGLAFLYGAMEPLSRSYPSIFSSKKESR